MTYDETLARLATMGPELRTGKAGAPRKWSLDYMRKYWGEQMRFGPGNELEIAAPGQLRPALADLRRSVQLSSLHVNLRGRGGSSVCRGIRRQNANLDCL